MSFVKKMHDPQADLYSVFNLARSLVSMSPGATHVNLPVGEIDLRDGTKAKVFVEVARFDRRLLVERPETNGLVKNKQK